MGLLTHLILLCLATSFAVANTKLSAYQVLQGYDFPAGILPKGVSSYEFNRETGDFSVHLNDTCSFKIESYQLKYKATVTGRLSKDRISNLNGVNVKVLFFWLNIVEVVRDGDELDFSVGIASADFPVDNFEESPQCGCGFDCGDDFKGYWSS